MTSTPATCHSYYDIGKLISAYKQCSYIVLLLTLSKQTNKTNYSSLKRCVLEALTLTNNPLGAQDTTLVQCGVRRTEVS